MHQAYGSTKIKSRRDDQDCNHGIHSMVKLQHAPSLRLYKEKSRRDDLDCRNNAGINSSVTNCTEPPALERKSQRDDRYCNHGIHSMVLNNPPHSPTSSQIYGYWFYR